LIYESYFPSFSYLKETGHKVLPGHFMDELKKTMQDRIVKENSPVNSIIWPQL
jgi:hypothetical protein